MGAALCRDGCSQPFAYRKVSGILDLTREDLERLVNSIEQTYVA